MLLEVSGRTNVERVVLDAKYRIDGLGDLFEGGTDFEFDGARGHLQAR